MYTYTYTYSMSIDQLGISCTAYLMSQLVSNDHGNPLLAGSRVGLLIVEEGSLAVCDETPVLHRTGREIRDGKEI